MAISFQGAILYKKTSTGKIQYWKIYSAMNEIVTLYGQVGGKEQKTVDVIASGKNIGRSNATTPEQQAYAEAKARWEKQLKKGYVKTVEEAEAGAVDEVIEGGVAPMLAHSFDDHGHKIEFPAYLSPKLDGIRCIAVIEHGRATLWTRTRKPINSMPHIVRALEERFAGSTITLDGELYHPDYKDNFNKIVSLVRPEEPVEGHEIVQYHIFDMIPLEADEEKFYARYYILEQFAFSDPLFLVPQVEVENKEKALELTAEFIKSGYEGGMIKNLRAPYEFKRSYHLQKIKTMLDAEFVIIGMEEGRGKLSGHIGAFLCKTESGMEFKAKLKGELEHLRHLFNNSSEWQGKKLTVQYQGLTPDGAPRFPVGLAIRNYE